MAQDDYYYEIQLTNKQLVFYFLAGSAALILSFLAGVKVGRGVEETASADAGGMRRVAEDRIVPEEPAATRPAAPEDLTYAQRLEADKVEDSLEKPALAAEVPTTMRAATPPPTAAATRAAPRPTPAPATTLAAKPSAPPTTAAARAAAKAAPKSARPAEAKPGTGSFTIQVGAFKDRATADSVAARLKGKGYEAYVVAPDGPEGGLFNVRVGSYPARADAERTQAKLRDEEKYKPFIVKN